LEDEASRFDESFQAKYNLTRRELEIFESDSPCQEQCRNSRWTFYQPADRWSPSKEYYAQTQYLLYSGLVRFAIENQLG
jgi:hypothetical protein